MSEPEKSTVQNNLFKWSDAFSDHYEGFRPVYTDDFYRIILQYHRQYGNNQWEACHDAGTGNGIVAQFLLQHFGKVYGSDLDESVISAQKRLEHHQRSDRLHFEAHRAEEMDAWLPKQSMDMVTMAEAIHWTNPASVVAAAATVLKPGGTLALWCYGPVPFFLDNDEARKILEQILYRKMNGLLKDRISMSTTTIMGSALDIVAIDDALFENERRVKWCADHHFTPHKTEAPQEEDDYESEIGRSAVVDEIHDPSMWAREADMAWCRGYVKSLDPSGSWNDDEFEDLWKQLEAALGQLKTVVSFPAALILATRRA